MAVMTTIQQFQIIESLFLQSNQHTGKQFFISYSIVFQTVGHDIINILDKYDISIQIVQIFNQSTMTSRTEKQFAIITERLVLHISGNGISTCLLFGEADIIFHTIFLGIFGSFSIYQFLE